MSNSQKNFLSIRSKLIAAVAMLLVASFMVVSSTYAWFTLSTAPEVTGITTQIGANGNLEIALYTGGTITTTTGGLTSLVDKNKTWGNIIDLNDEIYGLSKIILKPSVLALGTSANGETVVDTIPLITPSYGSDGRVTTLSKNGFYGAANIPEGTNVHQGFVRNDNGGYGVRALGTASNMTPQQLEFATAASAVKNNLDAASNAATSSLVNNGAGLVTLILKGVTDETSEYVVTPESENELAALGAMITALEKAPENIETALKNYFILILAKDQEELEDNKFSLLMSTFGTAWSGIFTQLKAGATEIKIDVAESGDVAAASYTVTIPPEYQAAVKFVVDAHTEIAAQVAAAKTAYTNALDPTKTPSVTFTTVRGILENLMDISLLEINGEKYETIQGWGKNQKANWAIKAMNAGIRMKMAKDSGVYASIASVTKDIDITFTAYDVSAAYGDLTVEDLDLNIRMYTELGEGNIVRLNPTLIAEPEKGDTKDNEVISDTFAYVLDFAFRTNAAGSNLLLQQEATDRIYGENEDTEAETWGGGSYMAFATQAGFGDKEAKALMAHIRIVFADTITGEIYACAGLDSTTAKLDAQTGEIKATVKLCTYETNKDLGNGLTTLDFDGCTFEESQVITALGQNEIANISVYVYLDGNTVTNEAVTSLSDVSGNLNLQFASDAELKPMDYSGLQKSAS